MAKILPNTSTWFLDVCFGWAADLPLFQEHRYTHPNFDIDERAIAIGAKILGRAVVLWSHPKRLSPFKDETGT